MPTVVVTDSSAVTSHAPAVCVVPITVLLPDGEKADTELSVQRVLRALRRGETVKTRAPSVIDYLEAIEGPAADAAVVVTPAAELTSMHSNAAHAVDLADRPAAVVDSRSASAGHALVVESARRCALGGGTLAQVVQAAERAADRVRLIGAVPSVAPIAASGILPSPALEGLDERVEQPMFRLADGVVAVAGTAPPGTDPAAALADLWRRDGGPRGGQPLIFTTTDERTATRLAGLVGAGGVERPSAAMTVHTGPDVVGVAWLAGRSTVTDVGLVTSVTSVPWTSVP